jgi:5-deoxy-glucuronate isomerase
MACGRVRKTLVQGWNPLVQGQLENLRMGALLLEPGHTFRLSTMDREYACVLIHGECTVSLDGEAKESLGPRRSPFEDLPEAVYVSREMVFTLTASRPSLLGMASAPAAGKTASTVVRAAAVGGGKRGAGNWEREVRFVCWSDNTEGNMLLAGETVTPSGNWSTIPPHRHQYDRPGEEAAYEEVYFFRFSRPQGFGLARQFDDEGGMDQAWSLRDNDVLYMSEGYHPVTCAPGADLYHLTFICGPRRISQARVHPDFQFLLEQESLENPYARQTAGSGDSSSSEQAHD